MIDLEALAGPSTYKIEQLIAALNELDPGEDQQAAAALVILGAILPTMRDYLPDDPGELDRWLEVLARFALQVRSDDAQELLIYTVHKGVTAGPVHHGLVEEPEDGAP